MPFTGSTQQDPLAKTVTLVRTSGVSLVIQNPTPHASSVDRGKDLGATLQTVHDWVALQIANSQ